MCIHFTFLITARQALPFAERCINSIKGQRVPFPYDWIYVDDDSGYSNDEKAQLRHLLDGHVLFLDRRYFQLGAIAQGMMTIKKMDTIVCLIDGDDYLVGDALSYIAAAYLNPDVALSYGNVLLDFRPYQDLYPVYFSDKAFVNTQYPNQVWQNLSFRQDGFRCFHLRTFRRWLWNFLDPAGFYREDKSPIRASGDSAYIFPMLELLGDKKHVAFIEEPIYIYRLYSGNVHNHDKKSQFDDLAYIRFGLKKYQSMDRTLLHGHLSGER